MLLNYFKIAWRSLLRGKSFSLINICGLTVGMTGAIFIGLWIQHEISFDSFHSNKDRLYQVYFTSAHPDNKSTSAGFVSQPLGPALKKEFPEVQSFARIKDIDNFLVTANNKSFINIKGAFTDTGFFSLFSFPLASGSITAQLNNVYSISITQSLAIKLFGSEDVIGKTIRLDSTDNFTVTGIIKNLPSNTRFDFEYLLPWNYLNKLGNGFENESWLSNNTPTFVLLKPSVNPVAFNDKIKNLSREHAGRNDIWTHFLFPLDQWHLYSEFENSKPVGGRISTVRIFAIIGAFILLIACINFMNLSTARSEKRAKEVGVRKVAGARKSWLIGQFITESFLTALIAGILAFMLVQLLLPLFNSVFQSKLELPFTQPGFWFAAIGFILFTSILAGSYPAFYLSSFQPVSIFRKQFRQPHAALSPRKILVVLQFTFAVALIISTIIIRNQLQYAQNRDKGYSVNNLVSINFQGEIEKNYTLIKQELINSGIASSVTKTLVSITDGNYHSWGFRWPNEIPKDTNTTLSLFSADADLIKTTGMTLLEGRDIDITKYPSDSFSVLLNQTAVKIMGLKQPVGQIIRNPFENTNWKVVGVVKDFVAYSPYEETPPIMVLGPAAWFNSMHIKFNSNASTTQNLSATGEIFKKYNPAYPFDYHFTDEEYAKKFTDEQRTRTMTGLFAGLAIFISCLGLFGLSAYVAESRTKEIGVRKVLGASVTNIATLLSFEFIKLVIISILIAIPVSWIAMNKWLEDYSYRIHISWLVFFIAAIIAVIIAFATVSFQSVKAALANPVKSLRTD